MTLTPGKPGSHSFSLPQHPNLPLDHLLAPSFQEPPHSKRRQRQNHGSHDKNPPLVADQKLQVTGFRKRVARSRRPRDDVRAQDTSNECAREEHHGDDGDGPHRRRLLHGVAGHLHRALRADAGAHVEQELHRPLDTSCYILVAAAEIQHLVLEPIQFLLHTAADSPAYRLLAPVSCPDDGLKLLVMALQSADDLEDEAHLDPVLVEAAEGEMELLQADPLDFRSHAVHALLLVPYAVSWPSGRPPVVLNGRSEVQGGQDKRIPDQFPRARRPHECLDILHQLVLEQPRQVVEAPVLQQIHRGARPQTVSGHNGHLEVRLLAELLQVESCADGVPELQCFDRRIVVFHQAS